MQHCWKIMCSTSATTKGYLSYSGQMIIFWHIKEKVVDGARERDTGLRGKGRGNENPFNNLELLNTFKSTRRHPRPPQNPKNSIPRTYLLPTATIFFSFLFLNNRQGIMANYEPKSGWPRLVHLTQTTSFELDITFYFIYLCIYIFFQNTWKLTGATV